jgi:hypothetical protein
MLALQLAVAENLTEEKLEGLHEKYRGQANDALGHLSSRRKRG